MADATEASDHLVGGEQDVVLRAQLAHAPPVARGRHERPAGVLYGLHVHEAYRLGAHGEDRPLELVEQEGRELLFRLLGRTVIAVRVRDVPYLWHERLERHADGGDAVDRQRTERRPVVRDVAGDCLVATRSGPMRGHELVVARLGLGERSRQRGGATREVVLARELPGRLDRVGPAGHEEDAVEVARSERRHLLGELDRAGVRVRPVRVERQLAHLLERRLADLLAERVAEVYGEQAGQGIEVALAVHVLEVAAVAADDDGHLGVAVAAHAREVQPQVVARSLLKIGDGHTAPLARLA